MYLNDIKYLYKKVVSTCVNATLALWITLAATFSVRGFLLIILYVFNFWRYYSDSFINIFYILFRWGLFLKIKKYLFFDDISNVCSFV
jgi:hypothetical protein